MGFNLGLAAGGFAKGARDTYQMLSEEDARIAAEENKKQQLALQRQDNELALRRFETQREQFEKNFKLDSQRVGIAAESNAREGARFRNEEADRADQAAALKDFQSGAARGGLPEPMRLGGPKPTDVSNPAAPAAAAAPPAQAGAAPAPRPSAIPTAQSAPAAAKPSAPAAAEAPVRGPAYYKQLEDLRERESVRKARDTSVRATEQSIKKGDFELASQQAKAKLSSVAVTLGALDGVPDETPVSDAKTAAKMDALMKSFTDVYSAVPDGQYAKYTKNKDGTYTMQAYNEETDQPADTPVTFRTLADIRRAAYAVGQGIEPDSLAKASVASTAAELAQGEAKNSQEALKLLHIVTQAADNPDDPEAFAQGRRAADLLAVVDPKRVMGTREVVDENGVKVKEQYNMLTDGLTKARTPETIKVTTSEGKAYDLGPTQFLAVKQPEIMHLVKSGAPADAIVESTKATALKAGYSEKQFKVHILPQLQQLLQSQPKQPEAQPSRSALPVGPKSVGQTTMDRATGFVSGARKAIGDIGQQYFPLN